MPPNIAGFFSARVVLLAWCLLVLLLCAIAAPHITIAATTLTKPPNNLGLIGYWSFDEGTSTKATDFSGNGNTGTLTTTGSILPAWVNGNLSVGGYLYLSGTPITSLPDNLSVGGDLYLSGTKITSLPDKIRSRVTGKIYYGG